MAAFMRLKGIDGESIDPNHVNWIVIESMSSAIQRSIRDVDARGMERVRGRTSTPDVVVFRYLDKSSAQLFQSCVNGDYYESVDIHFCKRGLDYTYFNDESQEAFTTKLSDFQQTYLKYRLFDVVVRSYSFHGSAHSLPRPCEAITISYRVVEWEYTHFNPRTNASEKSVPADYRPGGSKSGWKWFSEGLRRLASQNPSEAEPRACPRCGNCELIEGDCVGPDLAGAVAMTESASHDFDAWQLSHLPGREFHGCGQCGLLWKDINPDSLRGRSWIGGSLCFERGRRTNSGR